MNWIFAVLLYATQALEPSWFTNMEAAREKAAAEHKQILLNFSGSDWCGPCIRMHKELFASEVFGQYAQDNLVLVQADFPRQKKHQLASGQLQHNEALAARYNQAGIFPLTVLLDTDGRVLKTWEGNPGSDAAKFVAALKTTGNAGR